MGEGLLALLTKLIPTADILNLETVEVLHSDLTFETKVQTILSNYFKKEREKHGSMSHQAENILKIQAKYIHKLFPYVDLRFIEDQLNIYRDLPNRKYLVLRQLVYLKDANIDTTTNAVGIKRELPAVENLDNLNNNEPSLKLRKLNCTITEQPSTSSAIDFTSMPEMTKDTYASPRPNMFCGFTQLIEPNQTIQPNQREHFYQPELQSITSSNKEVTSGLPTTSTVSFARNIDVFDLPVPHIASTSNCATTEDSSQPTNSESCKERDSQNSDQTEIYNFNEIFEENEIPVAQDYTVSNMSSTNIKIKKNTQDGDENVRPSVIKEMIEPSSSKVEPTISSGAANLGSKLVQDILKKAPDTPTLRGGLEYEFVQGMFERLKRSSYICTSSSGALDLVPPSQRLDTIHPPQDLNPIHPPQPLNQLHPPRSLNPILPPQPLNPILPSTPLNPILPSQPLNTTCPSRFLYSVPFAQVEGYCDDTKAATNMNFNDSNSSLMVDSESDVEEADLDKWAGLEEHTSSVNNDCGKTPHEEDNFNKQLVNNLCNIFPEACPKYIRQLCGQQTYSEVALNNLIGFILDADGQYPKRPKRPAEPEIVPSNQVDILKELLPDADPDYLSMKCDQFEGKPELVREFINNAMEKRNYPTKKEYLRRQQLSAQQKQYTTDFSVENFIKVIPNPHTFFADPARHITLNTSDCHYALVFLRNKFNKLPIRMIQSTFLRHKHNISTTINELERSSSVSLKTTRKAIQMPTNVENIPLLQELAYYSHINEINAYLEQQKKKEEEERQEAKQKGLMKTCSCCFDEEVLPKNIYRCENGCEFCKDCVVKSSEIHFAEGKLQFPCLMNCSSLFSLQTLQLALYPKLFSKIAQKKTLEEIKAAGIEELEMCPFCDFATIIPEGYKIFTCMNPECMKESCRLCKEPSHIPLRCDEIEKDEDVKARVFVENKMTEALLRKCWKCGIKFFKEEGCNKMTCSCGAQMCYVCGQPVKSYQHFNGNGGDRYDLCPLYSDSNVLNKENVLKGAEQAKAEIGNVQLKHDPTTDVNQHYQERRKKFPQEHLLVGQMPFMGLQIARRMPPAPRNVPLPPDFHEQFRRRRR